MYGKGVKLAEYVKLFELEILHAGTDYGKAELTVVDVNRPGLQLLHVFDYFDPRRLQVIGKAEMTYLNGLTAELTVHVHAQD